MKVTTITCDWDGCTEETALTQPLAKGWASVMVGNLDTDQSVLFHLGPNHIGQLRDRGMRALSDVIPT